jgi:tetratricopeptide (TPR) repeat protein
VLTLVLALAAAAQSTDYDALIAKGRNLLNSGNAQMSLASAEQAIGSNKDRWEAYALAGAALMDLKRYEDAADRFTQSIALAPEAKQAGLRDLRRQALAAASGAPASAPAAKVTQAEVVLWKSIENSTDPQAFRGYLDAYPHGIFASAAQAKIEQFTRAANEKKKADELAESQKASYDKQHIRAVHQHSAYHQDDFGRLTFTPTDVTFEGVQHQFHFTKEQISEVKVDCRIACGLEFHVIGDKRYTFIAVTEDAFNKRQSKDMWSEPPTQMIIALRKNWGFELDKQSKASFKPASQLSPAQ